MTVDEDPNKCCFCIPIDVGIILIGASIVYSAVMGVLQVLNLLSGQFIASIITGVCILPLLVASYYFVQYFRNRSDKDARANLPTACVYSAISTLAQCVWVVLGIVLYGYTIEVVMSVAISSGVSFLVFAYCHGVCKRFASQ